MNWNSEIQRNFFLASVSYFKGNFESPFDKNLTRLMPFSDTKESEIEVLTMFQNSTFKYDDFDHLDYLGIKAKFIELPYKVFMENSNY